MIRTASECPRRRKKPVPELHRETVDGLARLQEITPGLRWPHPFVFPFWLQAAEDMESTTPPLLLAVHAGEVPLGIAPLRIANHWAVFSGDPEVCDYQDMITVPGAAGMFAGGLVRYLKKEGLLGLDLMPLRMDSIVMTEILPAAREMGLSAAVNEIDAAYALPLPDTWEGYLGRLSGHQRHEVRRKLRRLEDAGGYDFYEITSPPEIQNHMQRFIEWFQRYHPGKRRFMDARRARFFDHLAQELAKRGMLRLFVLAIGNDPAAMTLCIAHRNTLYLYNNAYDPRFERLNAGTLSKVLSLREGIFRRCRVFDFLKGEEPYKRRLGGRRVPLYRCRIRWP